MILIKNWRAIAMKSHSMWAFYLSLAFLVLPEVIYVLFERDTNPRLWFWIGIGLLIYGILGRLKDQGISR